MLRAGELKMLGLFIWLCCAVGAALIASSRDRDAGLAAVLGFLFGPLALIGYAVAGKAGVQCPRCAEIVRRDAKACRYCGQAIPQAPPVRRDPLTPEQIAAEKRRIWAVVIAVGAITLLLVCAKIVPQLAQSVAHAYGYHFVSPIEYWFGGD
jgi:hypothetical protein